MTAIKIFVPILLVLESLMATVQVSPYQLTEKERSVVESAVMAEAGGECYTGQLAVAQAILDGALRNDFDVVYSIKRYQVVTTSITPSESVKRAVSEVFDDGYRVTAHPMDLWYATWIKSPWHESQKFVFEVGLHRFFWMSSGLR